MRVRVRVRVGVGCGFGFGLGLALTLARLLELGDCPAQVAHAEDAHEQAVRHQRIVRHGLGRGA